MTDVIMSFSPSAKKHLGKITVGIILCLFELWVLGAIILVFAALKILDEKIRTRYFLYDNRIVIKKGIIAKRLQEIRISDIREIKLNQGVWQRILRFGDIQIGSSNSSGMEMRLQAINAPQKILDKINLIRDKE